MSAKTIVQTIHFREYTAFFADKSVPTALGQNQEQHCVGADLSAKTLVQTIHFREYTAFFADKSAPTAFG
ncbi:hypothetical protein, partial [Pseudomonas syringae group genomosp. 3]|uniref:hypothetical protein n=1 Tax=Pseudomonas syringae group genomosp. 3 TaxID=251701 RepID=UPI001C7E9E07